MEDEDDKKWWTFPQKKKMMNMNEIWVWIHRFKGIESMVIIYVLF